MRMGVTSVLLKKKPTTSKQKFQEKNKTYYAKFYRNWRDFNYIWRGYLLELAGLISFIFSAL
jgi:hypothetical protein